MSGPAQDDSSRQNVEVECKPSLDRFPKAKFMWYVGSYFCNKSTPRIWASFRTFNEAIKFVTTELKANVKLITEGEEDDEDEDDDDDRIIYQMDISYYKSIKLRDEDCVCMQPEVLIQEGEATALGSHMFMEAMIARNT